MRVDRIPHIGQYARSEGRKTKQRETKIALDRQYKSGHSITWTDTETCIGEQWQYRSLFV